MSQAMRRLMVLAAGVALSAVLVAPADAAQPVRLFDGTSTEGWSQAGPGGFDVGGGKLTSRDGMGLLWYHGRQFGDFILTLDWRVTSATDNSGVFLRFPDPGGDPWVGVNSGYEIQINDNPAGDPQKTGAVYNFQQAARRASKPVGQWNSYLIKVVGQRYQVFLNGELVNDFTGTHPDRGRTGYVGLQNHDPTTHAQFRNLWLRPLT
ncbi:3-keto-disaccharide hydrolase [Amycolatopsis nigrescens]|uniref:3-keto-disaccharide hydrolase n=1 Tax=Amycolatopsis nigrescens TaxID=381445 RepID=UPI00036AEE90|nr:DUF1080 domain-containing protein [Amycolatopsis nigrescens]